MGSPLPADPRPLSVDGVPVTDHVMTAVRIRRSHDRRHRMPGYGWECICGACSYGWDTAPDARRSWVDHVVEERTP